MSLPTDTEARASRQTEALKALADWCKWMIALQGLAAGAIVRSGLAGALDGALTVAGACFIGSILAATMLLGGIPDALQHVPYSRGDDDDIYAFRQFARWRWVPSVPLRLWAFLQHALMIAALIASLWWLAEGGWSLMAVDETPVT